MQQLEYRIALTNYKEFWQMKGGKIFGLDQGVQRFSVCGPY